MDDKPYIQKSAEMREAPSSPSPLDTNIPSPTSDSKSSTIASRRTYDTSSRPTVRRLQTNRTSSATNSPIGSRESSPVRPQLRNTTSAARSGTPSRSRKNSQDISPSRSTSNQYPPSAAAIQRVLSAQKTPHFNHVASEASIRTPIPQKPLVTSEVRDGPRWPVSPRIRSPPPRQNSLLSPRRTEPDFPPINVQRTSPTAEPTRVEGKSAADSEPEENLLTPGMRTPARGVSGCSSTLETVQEISQPNTPSFELDGAIDGGSHGNSTLPTGQDLIDGASVDVLKKPVIITTNESGSESGGKGDNKMKNITPTTSRPGPPKSFSGPSAGRGKPSGEGSAKNMTVETETVSSIPQIALATGAGGLGANGSLRAKQSTETIRPRKEKKKSRKAPSVASGTGEQSISRSRLLHHHSTRSISSAYSARSPDKACGQGPSPRKGSMDSTSPERAVSERSSRRPSLNLYSASLLLTRQRPASSKADIFEAKVASAVDEANSSDSEETFVYESNPPEQERPRRFHSRTPSATSMASQIDARNGLRSMMDNGGHSVAMKKSMKFANSSYTSAPQEMSTEDDGKGTSRSNLGRGTAHHHFSRWGRNGGNGHASLFDNESPFPNAAKSKFSAHPNRQGSRPTSPRVVNSARMSNANGKRTSPISSGYDLDDAADDERTPLIPSTIRSARSSRIRRGNAPSSRHIEHQRQNRSFFARFAGCMFLSLLILLVVAGAVVFLFATTQPLANVKVLALKNILASEQDVIIDLQVIAQNPNLVAVTIDSMDMVIFAKSKYAGTDSEWWTQPSRRISMRRGTKQKRDDPIDDPPVDDDPNTNPNLEIGHIYDFESPLIFEGSPFQRISSVSVGEMRILKPGNQTEPRGSERWGRVLQHEFELIVRGTLKYTLPLSSKARSVGVEGRVTVKPNAADQDPDNIHIIDGTHHLFD